MGRQYSIALLLLVLATPALVMAQGAKPANIKTMCRELVQYQPSGDVEYQPGKDVRGRDVAPADLADTPQLQLPETTLVAITVDQAAKLNLPANTPYRPEAYIGEVTVMKNGDVYFNRKRISQPQIQALCNE